MNHTPQSPITRTRIATRLSWLLAAATAALARAEFVPGHIYVTHAGYPPNCGWAGYPPTDRVYDVDPATGQYTLLRTKFTCQNLSSGIFTPDGSAMLAARSSANEVIRIHPDGTAETFLTAADGLSLPGSMTFGDDGSLFVVNNGSRRIWRFPAGGAPGAHFGFTPGTGEVAKGASGDVYWGGSTDVDPIERGRVYRFTDEGVRIEFDRFDGGISAIAADAAGNVFVVGADSGQGGVWVYRLENPSARQLLSTGFPGTVGLLAPSPDGTAVYAGLDKLVYRIDVATGSRSLIATLDDMTDARGLAVYVPEPSALVALIVAMALVALRRYKPPYFFQGARPVIQSAPAEVVYGDSFIVTPDVSVESITKVRLIRPGSVTHSINFDQRMLELDFAPRPNGLQIFAPSSGNEAPPGYYLLFICSGANGSMPSEGRFIRLGT